MNSLRHKQPFFRWFLITWPLVAFILYIVWLWLFYAFFIFSIIYWTLPLLKRSFVWSRNNQTKLAITLILLIVTVATAQIWLKAEFRSYMIETGGGWYTYPQESRQTIASIYTLALQRIGIIWAISASWSLFLGLKNKLRKD